jgi:hypothetical protein
MSHSIKKRKFGQPARADARRQHQSHDIEALTEIGAKLPFRDGVFRIAIGRADDPHIDLDML